MQASVHTAVMPPAARRRLYDDAPRQHRVRDQERREDCSRLLDRRPHTSAVIGPCKSTRLVVTLEEALTKVNELPPIY